MRSESNTEFERIYKQYYKKSFFFTRSYVHNDRVAEDIVSEALITLWERVQQHQVAHPEVYLLAMLKNKALDYLRHETVRKEVHSELREALCEELDLRISFLEACDPEEIFSEEIQRIVQQTLSTFSKTTRQIFTMSRFEHASNKQIALLLGMTVKNVEYHISKVLKALRVSLKDYLPLYLFLFLFE